MSVNVMLGIDFCRFALKKENVAWFVRFLLVFSFFG